MDSTSLPNPQPPVTATIDVPDPAPWVDLQGNANIQDYGWRQPRYNALSSGRGFDDDFSRVVHDNPRLPFGFHFATAPGSVVELVRFADFRQTKFEGKALKDGSNLVEFTANPVTDHMEVNGGLGLQHMYTYMKNVLQILYRNNLIELQDWTNPFTGQRSKQINKEGITRFMDLLRSGANNAYHHEKTRLNRPNSGPEFALGFEWVGTFSISVVEGIVGIQAALWWSIEHGYDPIPHMQMAINRVPAITRLILYLLNREKAFNDTLAREHIEDLLHDKRINWFTTEDMFAMGATDALARVQRYDGAIKPLLVEWQKRMRACFDYRMLRDWGYGRHWKKMYLVFDEPPESEERAAIEMFKRWAINNSKLAYEMFAVHPINKCEIPDGDICTICYCGWEGTELVLDLHCGHRFHPNCIIRHWDNPNLYSNPCANCRMSNGWLRDRMDFEAQKLDTDYASDHGAMAKLDQNYQYGIRQAVLGRWPGGIQGCFRPNDGHHEYYWRTHIQAMRTPTREARYAADPALADLDGRGI